VCDVPSDLAVTRADLGMSGQEVLGGLAEALRRGAEEELVMQREPRPVVLDAAFYDEHIRRTRARAPTRAATTARRRSCRRTRPTRTPARTSS
jgi:hypothetical protein